MAAEPTPSGRSMLDVLRVAPFRRYMIGSAISDTGTWMQVMAQGWVMSTLTDKALMLGMVNFAAGLPMLALTMIGGSVADKYDKRRILLATQFVQIALAIVIGILLLRGQIVIWHIFVVAALLGISNSFEMPALSALVPELVKREQIASAIALDRAVFHGSRLLGPATAGLLIGLYGAASAFFMNAVSFVAFVIALISLPRRPLGTAEEEEKRSSGIKEGFRYVRNDKPSLAMIGVIAATTIFIFPIVSVMMPLYVRNELHLGPHQLGLLMAASGSGSVLGALGLLRIPRESRFSSMLCAVTVVALCVFALSRIHSFAIAACLSLLISLGLSVNFGMANTIVQERAPNYLRGRVAAIFGLSFFGILPIAGLVITSVSDLIGMRNALAAGAVCYGITTWVVLTRVRRGVLATKAVAEVESQIAAVV